MAVKATNQITITDITDAYSVFMDNDAYSFMADNSGGITGSCLTNIKALCGTESVTVSVTANQIEYYEQGSGTAMQSPPFTASVTAGAGNLSTTVTFTAGNNATLTTPIDAVIPISVDSTITVYKRFTITAAKTGAQGAAGADGAVWNSGTAITGTASTGNTGFAGKVGDYYLNTSTQNLYRCATAGTSSTAQWSKVANIKGTTGTAGSKWFQGAGAPSATTVTSAAAVNDQYLNTSNGDVYKCTAAGTPGTWSKTGSIKGADGNDGADAILIEIEANGPTVFKKNTDNVTLTPKVKQGATYLTISAGAAGGTCALGTIKWYKGSTDITTTVTSGSIEAQKSGSNYTGAMKLYGAAITNADIITCKLEA